MARFALLLSFCLSAAALSAAPIASLASLEGDVSVARAGLLIPSEKVGEGFALEAFDTVSTGTTGRTDVRLPGAVGLPGTLRLDPDTSLYLDLTSLKKDQTVGVELLTGAVTVSISTPSGASDLEVRTEVGTFRAGTAGFRVLLGPAGDALVLVTSGKVGCRVGERTVFAEPGAVVEVPALEGGPVTTAVNPSTQGAFERTWLLQRRQVFRDQAAVAFRTLGSRYQRQAGQVQRAWARVQRELQEAPPAAAAVASLRQSARLLERSFFRVEALRRLFNDGVLAPSLELNRGYPARDFFRQAAQDSAVWVPRLVEARALYKAVAASLGGEFPQAADGSAVTYGSDYFH